MVVRRVTESAARLTLREVGVVGILDFNVGWRPGSRPDDRWTTFGAFLQDYRLVRTELLARPVPRRREHPFAEALHQRMLKRPDADVEAVGQRLYWDWFSHAADE